MIGCQDEKRSSLAHMITIGLTISISGFANTDLDYHLHQREITHLVMAGMIASTCLESTARYGREL